LTTITQLRRQLGAIAKRTQPPQGPRRRLTTVENQQELDRVLAEIGTRPPYTGPSDPVMLAAAQLECARVLAILQRLTP
jgi:hypothetical protein